MPITAPTRMHNPKAAAKTGFCQTSEDIRLDTPAQSGGRNAGPPSRRYSSAMRPLRYSINVTLDGCCDHREMLADEDLHRHAVENLAQADALLFGRVTYEMMEAAWRPPAPTGARPDWMEPFAQTIDAAKKYVVSSTLDRVDDPGRTRPQQQPRRLIDSVLWRGTVRLRVLDGGSEMGQFLGRPSRQHLSALGGLGALRLAIYAGFRALGLCCTLCGRPPFHVR
jgi:hypothetical protein